MKSLVDLWRCSADELAEWCHTSATYDIKTVVGRVEEEGTSFLTITLPSYSTGLETGLANGYVVPSDFPGFHQGSGELPAFLQGFLGQIFHKESGRLLQLPNIDAIFAIRFLTNLFAKIELPCSYSRVVRAMQAYVECEQEVEEWENTVSPSLISEFRKASHLLFADVFTSVDNLVYTGDVQPRHGPGSTADGKTGNRKYRMQNWTRRLEGIFPYGDYAIPNWRYYYLLDHVNFFEPGTEPPVKVIDVPKTLKSPRVIAMEPAHMQYMQQSLLTPLVRELESEVVLGRENLVFGLLGFTDQIPNREMARSASLTGNLATLDLKEASDRVPHLLVKVMLENHPWLLAGVEATRSTRAEIPKLGLCLPNLRKFASMGSALCFPMEAMVFLAIVFMGIAHGVGRPLSRSLVKEYRGKVRVYGDDIIVPVHVADSVTNYLNAFGIRINVRKSHVRGYFRESCGGDYYAGEDVTPIRLRKVIPSSRKDATKVAALVEFRNHVYFRGMWKTARYLDEKLETLLGNHFPIVEATSPILGRQSFLPYQAETIDEKLHCPMVKGWVLVPRVNGNSVENEWALVKCLTSPVMQEDVKHLERSGRPAYVTIKLRRMPPF